MIINPNNIHNYEDFITALLKIGMTPGGENGEGVFTLCDSFGEEIAWHTEAIETDPWQWRMRVLAEREDIAYAKIFCKKSGYLTKEWYPYFYAARRGKKNLEEAYQEGIISQMAKNVYTILEEHKELALHELKQYASITKESSSAFERAMTELQMGFYITICGQKQKQSAKGDGYGWYSTTFCLVEDFFEEEVICFAETIKKDQAYQKIKEHILQIKPNAQEKKLKKFILG